MRFPKLAVSSGQGSPSNILLAFPAGLQGYKRLRQFPPDEDPRSSEYVDSLVLSLHIDKDLPTIAYGSIEFKKSLEPDPNKPTDEHGQASASSCLAVFFAVDLGDADHLEPRRWTCRDISASRYERRYEGHSSHWYALELRTRNQLIILSDPLSDEMVPSTWEPRFLLRRNGARTGHGIISLDDRTLDFSNAGFVLRRDIDGHVIGMTPERDCEPRETLIVAQIIFPD